MTTTRKRFLELFGIVFLLFCLRSVLIQHQWSEQAKVCNFDCIHYVQITDHTVPTDISTTAFFPAWTSLIRGAEFLAPHVHTEVLAVWLSNLILFIAAAVAVFIAESIDLSTPIFKVFFLPAALLFFPFSASSSFGYGEPIFLLLYLLTLFFAQRKNYLWAAVSVGMLGLTRIQGVIVAGAFAFLIIFSLPLLDRKKKLFYALISLAPFLGYLLWQWFNVGDALAFVHSQSQWGRSFSPLRALLDQAPRPKMFPVMIWICLLGSFFALRKGDFFWAFLGLATLGLTEVPLFSGGLMSYARYLSVNVGLFVFLAKWLAKWLAQKPAPFMARKPWLKAASALVELLLSVWAVHGLITEAFGFLISGICP